MPQPSNEQPVLSAWPGFLIAFLLTIGAVVVQTPFQTERPPEPKAGLAAVGAQNVDARLWQDPFAAMEEARKADAEGPHSLSWLAGQIARRPALRAGGAVDVLAILVQGGPSVGAAELRRRDRYAALSGLMLEGLLPDDPEHVGYFVPHQVPPGLIPFEWFSPFGKEREHGKEREQAGRRRDLLLLWIDQEGLRQPGRAPLPESAAPAVGPASLEKPVAPAGMAAGGGTDVQASAGGLAKGTASSEGPRLLARLSALFSAILKESRAEPTNVRFAVIGPRDSQALREIRAEAALGSTAQRRCREGPKAQMWSPFATIPEERIPEGDQVPGEDQGVCVCDGADACVAVLPPGSKHRTIADDSVLVKLLVEELGRRHIGSNSRIALVGQWDTAYSRALADEFKDVWYQKPRPKLEFVDKGGDRRILRPSYMRGLDGVLPGGRQKNSDKNSSGESAKAVERAEGDAQLDYLRRMRDALVARDAELRAACPLPQRLSQDCGIHAVGVFGNDYFDKLLVLKALKPVLGNAVFFTTDLDADMLNPKDNLVTRNLIVASGFGLTLHPRLQREVPPLRDSYQTSLLLAVRLALQPEETKNHAIPPPARLFEVGRTAPVELVDPHQLDAEGFMRPADHCTSGIPGGFDVHPRKDLTAHFRVFVEGANWVVPASLYAILILGGVLLVLTLGPDAVGRTLRYWWRVLTGGPLPALVFVASLALFIFLGTEAWRDIRGGGEPFSWIQGVSVWPAELVRLIAGVAALVFLVVGHDRLCGARRRIERDFGLGSVPTPGKTGQSEAGLTHLTEPPGGEPLQERSAVSAEPEVPVGQGPPVPAPAEIGGTAETWPETGCGDLLSTPDAARSPGHPVPVVDLWRCYVRGCRPLPRWMNGRAPPSDASAVCPKGWAGHSVLTRILPEVVLFLLLALSLMVVLGFPNRPVRSEAAWWIDLAVILLVLIPFLGLLFYMVDATRQTLTLARDLAGPALWPEESLQRFGLARWRRPGVVETAEAGDVDWLDVHLIARVSRPVGDLVWYPVLVLVILALARHPVFDAWDFPPALMFVMLAALLYVVGCAWALRLAAERVRKMALGNLSLARLRAQGTPGREACIGQLDSLFAAVNGEREGAFRPFSQQPVVQALLTLASSVSGLALIQYSSLLNL